MRISTSQFYNSNSANYQRSFSNLDKTRQEASDGIRVRRGADDPVGAARLLQLQQQQNMLDQYTRNVTNVRNALGTAESTLNAIGTIRSASMSWPSVRATPVSPMQTARPMRPSWRRWRISCSR